MTASADEAREELRNRYADVIRVASGLAGSAWQGWDTAQTDEEAAHLAAVALAIVTACELVCGIGDGLP